MSVKLLEKNILMIIILLNKRDPTLIKVELKH